LLAFAANDAPFRIKQFIVLEDVLLPAEKQAFKMESVVNARFFLLDTDSKLTDLGRSFPIELAATGSCLVEMETLNRCLTNRMGRSNGEKLQLHLTAHQVHFFPFRESLNRHSENAETQSHQCQTERNHPRWQEGFNRRRLHQQPDRP
jgi:hypothetical protein